MTHPLAGEPAPLDQLTDIESLLGAYGAQPDPAHAAQRVAFGTSGHRGSSLRRSFNEAHLRAIAQAICEYRAKQGITGPLFLGKDTHALSGPAERTVLGVLAANGVRVLLQAQNGFTPTPVISRAIVDHNRTRRRDVADGIVITPSHNPPEDGGIKYNAPNGGPADTSVTGWIEARANALLDANQPIQSVSYEAGLAAPCTTEMDFAGAYIDALESVIDMAAIRQAGVKIGVDPLGGAAVDYWPRIAQRYALDLTVVNPRVDPQFAFMPLDHDGRIRMDCSSRYAMAGLIRLKDQFDIAWSNDADVDRHGIVTPSGGLMNPNHFLCVAVHYLLTHRPQWPAQAAVGKTIVSSSLINRVVQAQGRNLLEVPVGFKWFSPGLLDASVCFGGEESAGATFLRRDGTPWTTDKDGIILGLLAAEITATTGKDPSQYYTELVRRYGATHYVRIDAPATASQKTALRDFADRGLPMAEIAGEPVLEVITVAPGNGAAIGGLKVITANGWFAARPSGTENICKLYAESFRDARHLAAITSNAQAMLFG